MTTIIVPDADQPATTAASAGRVRATPESKGRHMRARRIHPGVPCWVDTSQPDPEAAHRFYGGLSDGRSRT